MSFTAMNDNLFERAVALLSRREHSQKELRDKLKSRLETTTQELDAVLAKLIELGYQSDWRFAQAFARSRLARGLGKQRILQELQQRGIDARAASKAYDENALGDNEPSAVIERVWRKKFGALPKDLKEKAKQQRFLAYKGFSGDDIRWLFDHLAKEDS